MTEAPARLSDPCYLYRWLDGDGRLLYVGITSVPAGREREHRTTSWWYPLAHRVCVDPNALPRLEAEAAERRAIETEGPVFNDIHAPGRRERILKYLESAGGDLKGLNIPRYVTAPTPLGAQGANQDVAGELAVKVREMAVGDEVGSIRSIAVNYSVSPDVARKAFALLVRHGLVRAEARRHVVADPGARLTDAEVIADLLTKVADHEARLRALEQNRD